MNGEICFPFTLAIFEMVVRRTLDESFPSFHLRRFQRRREIERESESVQERSETRLPPTSR